MTDRAFGNCTRCSQPYAGHPFCSGNIVANLPELWQHSCHQGRDDQPAEPGSRPMNATTNEVTLTEIRAALRKAGVEFRTIYAGTVHETIVVADEHGINDMAFGPNDPSPTGAAVSDGIDCAFYNGSVEVGEFGTQDWYAALDELVADAVNWASK